MPTFLLPHKTGSHRVAAIALYRALISQANKVEHDETRLHDLIKSRFHEARDVTSTKRLKLLFTAGYEAIDLLDGAVEGDAEAKSRIESLVRQAKFIPTKEVKPAHVKAVKHEKMDMFARPLPKEKLSGERKVPVLVNANSIPVLRFTKPQPVALSSYLRSRVAQRQKRQDLRWKLTDELKLARAEDTWEWYMNGKIGPPEDGSYAEEVSAALKDVLGKLQEEKEKNRVMAEKMQGIIDREVEMCEREKKTSSSSDACEDERNDGKHVESDLSSYQPM